MKSLFWQKGYIAPVKYVHSPMYTNLPADRAVVFSLTNCIVYCSYKVKYQVLNQSSYNTMYLGK